MLVLSIAGAFGTFRIEFYYSDVECCIIVLFIFSWWAMLTEVVILNPKLLSIRSICRCLGASGL